jgi:hypothetical protein
MVARPNNPIEKVRELQHQLFRAAKCKRERRFHGQVSGGVTTGQSCENEFAAATSCCERHVILKARMPPEKTIGKPYAGNPHVRFERGPQETEPARHRA